VKPASTIPQYQDRIKAKFLDCPETNPGLHHKNHPSSNSYGRRFGGLLFVRHDWPDIRNSSGSLAMFTAILLASSLLNSLAADCQLSTV
jgi:hypothetical protein